jgi:hypothetical protein
MKTFIISILVTAIYVAALVTLFLEFPKTMAGSYALFVLIMWYLMKTAPSDYELWPDLYKK